MSTIPEFYLFVKFYEGSSIKIQRIDILLFKAVQRYLIKTDTEFHTLLIPKEKLLSVIIKGLPLDITEFEILKGLLSKMSQVMAVRKFEN